MSDQITNHVEQAKQRFLHQYNDKPKLLALLSGIVEQIQPLEDAFIQLRDNRSLANAVGVQLDRLGDIIGLDRDGLNDTDYRIKLQLKIFANISEGDPETLIAVYAFIMGATLILYQDNPPAGFMMMANTDIPPGQETVIYEQLNKLCPAGVRMDFMGSFDPTDAFSFAGGNSPGLGFGELSVPANGGEFAKLHVPIDIAFTFANPLGGPGDEGFSSVVDPLVGGYFQ